MRFLFLIILMLGGLTGCAKSPSSSHTIDTSSGLEIIPSMVNNPYPDCSGEIKGLRIANLSKSRGLRVYLEEGQLCQRPQ